MINFIWIEWFMLPGFSQDEKQFELRSTYTHQHYISKFRFWIRNDLGYRHFFEENPYDMVLMRPRAILEVTSLLDFHPAVDFRLSINPGQLNSFEMRTWQGVSLAWPDVGRVMFDHFYRFEQRFYWTEGSRDEKIGLRSRYRLRMRVPLNNTMVSDRTYFVDLRGEIFLPHDKEIEELFASLLRIGMNVAYQHNSRWRYQLKGYFDGGKNTYEDERTVSKFIVELSVRTMF